jgi:hypothetical protein
VENLLNDSTKVFREENLQLDLSILGPTRPFIEEINRYEWSLKITGNFDFNYLKQLEIHFDLDKSGKDYYTIKDYGPKTAHYNFEKQDAKENIRIGVGASLAGPSASVQSGIPYYNKSIKQDDSFTFRHQGVDWNYYNIPLNPSIFLYGEAFIEFQPKALGNCFKINMIVIPSFCRRFLKLFKMSCKKNPRINLSYFSQECIDIKPQKKGSNTEGPQLIIAHSNDEELHEMAKYLANKYNIECNLIKMYGNRKFKVKETLKVGKDTDICILILRGEEVKMIED